METLKPGFVIVENKCFRKCDITASSHKQHSLTQDRLEEEAKSDSDDSLNLDDLKIDKDADGYVHSFELARSFYGKIIGSKGELFNLSDCKWFFLAYNHIYIISSTGSTINKINQETGVKIIIPRYESVNLVKIRSMSVKNIALAKKWMLRLVRETREKTEATHFVGVLFNTSEIKKSYESFKELVLSEDKASLEKKEISAELFPHPARLHMTICALTIMDSEELNHAVKIFKNCVNEKILPRLNKQTIKVRLSNLNYMHDDPSLINVLYGEVETIAGPITMQELADTIANDFKPTDLMVKEQGDKVKLHVTVMNRRYRKSKLIGDTKSGKKPKSTPFDGTDILAKHSNYYFGSLEVDQVHLVIRHSFDEINGYKFSHSMKFK